MHHQCTDILCSRLQNPAQILQVPALDPMRTLIGQVVRWKDCFAMWIAPWFWIHRQVQIPSAGCYSPEVWAVSNFQPIDNLLANCRWIHWTLYANGEVGWRIGAEPWARNPWEGCVPHQSTWCWEAQEYLESNQLMCFDWDWDILLMWREGTVWAEDGIQRRKKYFPPW